ncbi:hypothetical protein PF005_g8178 [Phytophthora fragariae]|uniref:DUF4954 domain-containing protein n=1 Tax=Phytophthora fragariae TaxID=53985 RepID=A0A6A3F5H9_9STRA|nr:hypothetical protein PF003_g17216 [Phytophthora fragariae]KAE8941075.1 hypothetical protein PF009_g9130 [Phytophthora fragariae]KAE9017097.1 hypothetical protein PF011_g6848 [Phytophthora fragariae]KAE9123535.1 hypothetical protein PF007_g7025 [Phytophthora fragariae]KAE9147535.1 hypothetical protein PF006_g7788 [Phytophthora fragariae]
MPQQAETHDLAALLVSDHVKYVKARRDDFTRSFFPLSDAEIRALEANGNSADDWSNVRKTHEHEPLQTPSIRQCSFHGRVALGSFSASYSHDVDGIPFRCGVYNSALSNAVVLDDALVKDTLVLKNVLVDARAAVIQCGSVTGPEQLDAVCGNGRELHVGVETGGRDLRVVADMPFSLGAAVATKRRDVEFLETYDAFVDKYVAEIKAPMAIVAQNARVRGCARVEGTFVGEHALVEDSDVANSTILSTAEEPSVVRMKSIVRDSIVQWNSTVETLSVVEGAFLCDTSHVERHGVVMSSVIGPNTSVAEGEVTSSFVGPFVGFHHQALLIASMWPKGKGNIGYGANVGSNHTLKAPDQELFHGEGVFFGLGCNVKFPSNFVKAPYSVIATAVNTLPQLVAMPFALINTPAHVIASLSPAINEISPGWVLSSSVFTVLRNEDKFRSRNKSKRTHIEAAIFRPEIVQYMKDARSELAAAEGKAKISLPNGEAVYTDKQVRGLGKNYMRESSRQAGIAAYTFFIKLYAVEALLLLVESGRISADGTVGTSDRSCYELATLAEEFDAKKPIRECLSDLVSMRAEVAKKAADGKARDDIRGQRIIPDYSDVHKPAASEGVVLRAQRTASEIKQRVAAFVARV